MLIDDVTLDAVRIRSPVDIRPAAMALRDAVASRCGLHVNITHNIATSTPMKDADGQVLAGDIFQPGGAGAAWWQVPLLGLTSPLSAACRLEGEPFWCNAHGIHSRSRNRALEALDLANFATRAFTRAAVVAPVHLPFGQIGAASFVHRDPAVDDLGAIFLEHDEVLALLARIFLSSYVKATEQPREQLAAVVLTRREVECLRWAAAGKTNDDIAIILGLKRTTIRFHIRSAAQKLDAVNRDQALFKAAQLGFLGKVR